MVESCMSEGTTGSVCKLDKTASSRPNSVCGRDNLLSDDELKTTKCLIVDVLVSQTDSLDEHRQTAVVVEVSTSPLIDLTEL